MAWASGLNMLDFSSQPSLEIGPQPFYRDISSRMQFWVSDLFKNCSKHTYTGLVERITGEQHRGAGRTRDKLEIPTPLALEWSMAQVCCWVGDKGTESSGDTAQWLDTGRGHGGVGSATLGSDCALWQSAQDGGPRLPREHPLRGSEDAGCTHHTSSHTLFSLSFSAWRPRAVPTHKRDHWTVPIQARGI